MYHEASHLQVTVKILPSQMTDGSTDGRIQSQTDLYRQTYS